MKNLEQQFSEDLSITKSSNSVREHPNSIPVDVLIDIFSRVVSVKSLARFRCVSKFWESVLRHPDFKELFLTKSLTRPRLFFTLEVNDELVTFSAPQPQNPDDNSSVIATRYKSFPKHFPTHIYSQICGLVLLQSNGRKTRVVCNPVTGESITLPKVKATGIQGSYLGFDPISKKFKVLCMTWSRYGWSRYGKPRTHQILTLETGKRVWRKILHPLDPHDHVDEEVCINGVLYYRSYYDGNKIVCFDFRFEEFSLIKLDRDMLYGDGLTFFNYKGKLGALREYNIWSREELELWVLEDAGKHKWSKRICQLPSSWDITLYNHKTVGTTGSGEIVFSPCWPFHPPKPFYISYYNIERNTLTRVNIHGFEEFKHHDEVFVDTSIDYVENMNFV